MTFIIKLTTAYQRGGFITQPLLSGDLHTDVIRPARLSDCINAFNLAIERAGTIPESSVMAYWSQQNNLDPSNIYGVKVFGWWTNQPVRDARGELLPRLRKPAGFEANKNQFNHFVPVRR